MVWKQMRVPSLSKMTSDAFFLAVLTPVLRSVSAQREESGRVVKAAATLS